MIERESAGSETGSKGENLASDTASGVGSGAAETNGRTGGPDLPIRHVDSVELLLRGAYERDGFDLVIRGQDGQVQVIEDYFGQLQTPTLLHGGAGLSPVMVRSLLTTPFSEGVQFAGPASGALGPAIGRVTLVRGEVKVTHADGSEDTLRRGDPIYRGDVVETGPNAFLLARMNDGNGPRGTAFSLGRNGRASFDEFDFVDDPDPDKDVGNFEATVFVGGFRYRSGALGSLKPISAGSHSVIRTPTAFIGIRGSELEGNVADDGETLVVHRDGVLDIFDINQQNDPVVLDTPGNTSFVLTDGSATKFAQPTAQQAATVEAALPPPISTTGEDDPNADEPDRDEAADTTPDETPAGPARPDGTPEDEAAEEEVQLGEDVEEEAEEDAEESEDDEEEDAERDVPDEDAEDAEGRAPPADEAPAEQQADQPAEPANTPAPPPAPAEETLSQQDQQEEREQVEQESTSQNTQEESPTPTQTTPERPPAPPQEELPPPDNPPEAMDDVFEVNADISATLDVLANDTDPDLGQTLQIAEVDTSGISGDVTIVDGNTLTYTPPEGLESLPAGESVQEVFAYSVTSGLLEDKAEVTVTVLGVNDAPTSADVLGVSASEDSSVPLSGSMFPFTDVDAEAELNGVRISSVEGGQLILDDVPIDSSELIPAGDLDNLVFIPEPNLNGTGVAGFLFSVGDGDLESDQHAFRFDISPIPDAPLTMADSYTLTESGSLEVPAIEGVLANDTDIDGDGVTVTSFQVLSDVGGSLQIDADGALTFIPDRADFAGLGANDSAIVDIEYTVTGAGGESAVGEVSITVTGENAVPVAGDDAFSVAASDQGVRFDLLDNDDDPEGDPISIVAAGAGAEGNVALDGTVFYTPGAAFSHLAAGDQGTDEFLYTISDGDLTDGGRVVVTVLGVNDAPTSADVLGVSASEDSSVPLSGSMFPFTDVDAEAELNGVRISSVEGGQLILDDVPIDSSELIPAGDLDNLVFIPEPNLNGTGVAGFLFSVGDGDLESDQHAFRFDISPIPDAPLTMADSYTLTESGSLEVPAIEGVLANDTDIDGDGVTVTSFQVLSDVGGSLQIDADGALTFIPDRADFAGLGANDSAIVDIEYTVTGAGGESAVGEVSITVTGENAVPVAGDDAFSVAASDQGVRFDLRVVIVIEGTQAASTTASFTAGLVNIGTLTFDNVYAVASPNVTVNVSGGALENQGTLNVIRTGAAGTFTLNAALDNSGSINVDRNITLAGNTISHTNQAGGTITVQDGHTLTIQGTGSTFTNDGTITLMGVSGASSSTTILDVTGIGTFRNNGSITGIGTVNGSVLGNVPTVGSSPGIVTINGDYTMAATSVFEVELSGEDPAIGYDVLDVRDKASVDGALRVELLNGFTPRVGATFAVLTAGIVAGGFTRVHGLEDHGSLVLDLAYTDNSVTLTAIPVTLAGTASSDVVAGTDGRDIVTAGAGDDVVRGLGVRDVAYGGPGDDTFVVDSGFDRIDGGSGIDTLVLGPDADVSSFAMRVDRVEELRLDGAELVLTPHTAAGLVDANGDDTAVLFLTGAGAASLVGWEVAGTEEVARNGESTGFVLFEAEGVTLYADADAVADGTLAVTMDDAIDLSGLDALAASTFADASVPDLGDVLDTDDVSLDALLGETESGQFGAANPPVDDASLLLVVRPDFDSLFDNAAAVFTEV